MSSIYVFYSFVPWSIYVYQTSTVVSNMGSVRVNNMKITEDLIAYSVIAQSREAE